MREENNLIFYHGTNTVFIENIKKYGLGGYDIVKESRAVELLSALNEIAENTVADKYMDYGLLRLAIAGILLQTPGDSMNWQHGSVYITPSLNRALKYACYNEIGSELFTHIYKLYNFLTEVGVVQAQELIEKYPLSKEIVFKIGDPIVIEIHNLEENDLLSEGGENPIRLLKKLNEVNFLNNEENDLDDFGFRLKKIIPYDQLVIRTVNKAN
jgi:hypothetical protein